MAWVVLYQYHPIISGNKSIADGADKWGKFRITSQGVAEYWNEQWVI